MRNTPESTAIKHPLIRYHGGKYRLAHWINASAQQPDLF